jgi:aspartyl-tRNA(Asn)/glutamyl-tRNA(Gln) amidotransferase subunit C
VSAVSILLGQTLFQLPMEKADLNIDHIAHLARVELTPEEKTNFAAQLGDVLQYIEELSKIDVSGVEPTAHAFPVYNVWSDDVARAGLPVDLALKNAPEQRDNMIAVPKVVE